MVEFALCAAEYALFASVVACASVALAALSPVVLLVLFSVLVKEFAVTVTEQETVEVLGAIDRSHWTEFEEIVLVKALCAWPLTKRLKT